MRIVKPLLMMLCTGILVLSASVAAKADEWNKKTIFTFKAPVEVPGMVLEPGTYVFQLLDLPGDRNVVQIFNADQTHLYKNVLTNSAYRLQATDKSVLTFDERAKGSPEAVSTWFYPGDNYGQQFVYRKVKAAAVASMTTSTLPTITPVTPAAQPATTAQVVPDNRPVQIAEVTPPAPALQATSSASTPAHQTMVSTPAHQTMPTKLPKTASPIPDLLLLGMLSLAGSAALHILAKRSA